MQQVAGHRGHVDCIDDGAVDQVVDDLAGHGNRHIGLGFPGGGAQMGRADNPVQVKQAAFSGRFGLEYIQGRAGYLAGRNRILEVVFIDDASAGTVHDHDAVLHFVEGAFVQQAGGLLEFGYMNGDVVGLGVEFIQAKALETGFFDLLGHHEGVVHHHPHTQPPGAVSHDGADFSETDDTQRFVEHLPPLQLFLVPAARFQGKGALGDIPGQRHHHGDGVLGGGNHIAGGCVHHHHAAFGRRRNIHIIQADAGPSDHFQLFGGLEQVFGHLGGAADHQPVVVTDDRFELFRRQPGVHVDFDAIGGLENLDSCLPQHIAD